MLPSCCFGPDKHKSQTVQVPSRTTRSPRQGVRIDRALQDTQFLKELLLDIDDGLSKLGHKSTHRQPLLKFLFRSSEDAKVCDYFPRLSRFTLDASMKLKLMQTDLMSRHNHAGTKRVKLIDDEIEATSEVLTTYVYMMWG